MAKLLTILAAAVWAWLRRVPFVPVLRPVDVRGRLFVPLFYRDTRGKLDSTWGYLSKPYTEQAHFRDWLLRSAAPGETPAITFLLTPNREGGNLWARFPGELSASAVSAAKVAIEELVRDGIAVIPCVYVDDPSGDMPRWWDIGQHVDGLATLHAAIGGLVSGYIVSIEQNERARSKAQIEDTIDKLRRYMPGRQVYGTHLQHRGAGAGYQWIVGNDTPRNADIIVAEASWNPDRGDSVGVEGIRRQIDMLRAGGIELGKVVLQEYNLNPGSPVAEQQRAALRGYADLRGIG